jgi:hypothetical protein
VSAGVEVLGNGSKAYLPTYMYQVYMYLLLTWTLFEVDGVGKLLTWSSSVEIEDSRLKRRTGDYLSRMHTYHIALHRT